MIIICVQGGIDMKRMKRLIIIAMAFLLLIPNYLGDAYTKDLSVSGYYYGRYDFGVRFIARYYGDSQTGVIILIEY